MHISQDKKTSRLGVIGGGAAGCFAAIKIAQNDSSKTVVIFEKSKHLLGKVKISGGGRCNVTHYCFDPEELVKYYPRGHRELLGPFHRFGPDDMMQWLEQYGVSLKKENDGRVFPCSDRSETIIECFVSQLGTNNIFIKKDHNIHKIEHTERGTWKVISSNHEEDFNQLLIATGGSPAFWEMLGDIGLDIIKPVPSLFTFNIIDNRHTNLQGISMPKSLLTIEGTRISAKGSLLITHKGISGPGVLSLSSRAARELHDLNYQFTLNINYVGAPTKQVNEQLLALKNDKANQKVYSSPASFGFPARLWTALCLGAGIVETKNWGDIPDNQLKVLAAELTEGKYKVHGKSTFKEEFVTAGGVSLKEINFKTMEAKRFPGLYFAGEVLDIDALTGGFNFQAAWTTAWIAAQGMTSTT